MNDIYTWNDLLVDISKLSNEERNKPVAVASLLMFLEGT